MKGTLTVKEGEARTRERVKVDAGLPASDDGRMARPVRCIVAVASATAAVCLIAPVAPAQDNLGEVLGTTILNNVLTGIALPQVPVPDPTTGEPAQPQETQPPPPQPATVPAPPAHALGYYCKDESKRHVRGFKGTPFGQCVAAMKQLKASEGVSPKAACASVTKRHFPGMKRTPYAVCVSGGRALIADRQ